MYDDDADVEWLETGFCLESMGTRLAVRLPEERGGEGESIKRLRLIRSWCSNGFRLEMSRAWADMSTKETSSTS